jgi:hypothetical protein
MVVMPDSILVPPLPRPIVPLAQPTMQWGKRQTMRRDGAESHVELLAHLRDTACKSLVYVQFV